MMSQKLVLIDGHSILNRAFYGVPDLSNAEVPGTILEVKVAVGDTVEAGQALAVLEAMKMENDISSPCAGKVLSVNTTKGAAVETGTLICVIG